MKQPQCTARYQCLEELARVMKQFGITDVETAATSKYVKYYGRSWIATERCTIPHFSEPGRWQFATAEVENKPVFIGDELYSKSWNQTIEITAVKYGHNGFDIVLFHALGKDSPDEFSWNPPKPKTGMIELPVEVIEHWAKNTPPTSAVVLTAEVCRAYLDKQKG